MMSNFSFDIKLYLRFEPAEDKSSKNCKEKERVWIIFKERKYQTREPTGLASKSTKGIGIFYGEHLAVCFVNETVSAGLAVLKAAQPFSESEHT